MNIKNKLINRSQKIHLIYSTSLLTTISKLPSPQSQSFSRSYGSNLPTSLIYIILLTRGYSPWRPDAVISTNVSLHSQIQFSRTHDTAPEFAPSEPLPNSHASRKLSLFQAQPLVNKKRQLFPGVPSMSSI